MFKFKNLRTGIAISIFALVLSVPGSISAEVKGSTAYLVNQSKYSSKIGKTLPQVKKVVKSQGYGGWRMTYNYHWCAWYIANNANSAYVGNYLGSQKTLQKHTLASSMANYFLKYYGTSKKYPGSYSPKAGDIVMTDNNFHIGIMVSDTKAVFGNEASPSWTNSIVVMRKPTRVNYYIPRPNWYVIYYSDGLSSTTTTSDMKRIPPKKAKFAVSTSTSSKKFTRKGYSYSYWYIYRQDFNKKTGKYTNYYYSTNNKTGKFAWVKSGTAGYTKFKKKVGTSLKFYYDINFASASIVLSPVWVKDVVVDNNTNTDNNNNENINGDNTNTENNNNNTGNENNNDNANTENNNSNDTTTDNNNSEDSNTNNQ